MLWDSAYLRQAPSYQSHNIGCRWHCTLRAAQSLSRYCGPVTWPHNCSAVKLSLSLNSIKSGKQSLYPDGDPDRHQNVTSCSLVHCLPSLKMSCKSVWKFLRKVANRQTGRQTSDRQTTTIDIIQLNLDETRIRNSFWWVKIIRTLEKYEYQRDIPNSNGYHNNLTRLLMSPIGINLRKLSTLQNY